MGFIYSEGENPNRPGVYRRFVNANENAYIASAIDGIGAMPINADWGPVGKVTTHYASDWKTTIRRTYGTKGTVDVAEAYMSGGLNTLYCVRVGNDDGICGSADLTAVKLTLNYPGDKAFTVTIRKKASDDSLKEMVIYDGTTAVETIEFATGEDEAKNLEEAVKAYESEYVTVQYVSSGTVEETANAEFSGGKNPTVTTESYENAYSTLDPYYYNTIITDKTDKDAQDLLVQHFEAAQQEGKLGLVVIGEAGTGRLKTRMTNAKAYNSENVVYFGSDYRKADGSIMPTAAAIAVVAGVIAATPSNQSITHRVIPGAAELTEALKNREYSDAISNGLLLLSTLPDGSVVFDSGINTLVNPDENHDDGWKKIKRTKVRIEMFDRLDRQLARLIGKVNVNADGIADVIQTGQLVLDEMSKEQKVIDPLFALGEKGYGADYGYFEITGVDTDALERIFLTYNFKYSENS